jgi:DNA-binding FrmR family transcriptional regulator
MAKEKVLPAAADQRLILARVNRAHGQLGAVARMIEEGRDCEEVVTQLAAVSKAINTAAFTMISSSLRECIVDRNKKKRGGVDVSVRLEKLFLTLA